MQHLTFKRGKNEYVFPVDMRLHSKWIWERLLIQIPEWFMVDSIYIEDREKMKIFEFDLNKEEDGLI